MKRGSVSKETILSLVSGERLLFLQKLSLPILHFALGFMFWTEGIPFFGEDLLCKSPLILHFGMHLHKKKNCGFYHSSFSMFLSFNNYICHCVICEGCPSVNYCCSFNVTKLINSLVVASELNVVTALVITNKYPELCFLKRKS